MIEIINKPDATGLGRIVVDGRFYGVPIAALELFVQQADEIRRCREDITDLVTVLKMFHGHTRALSGQIGNPVFEQLSALFSEAIAEYDNTGKAL